MKRSMKLPLLVALALGSSQVLAVDLGQIQVKSALGQPLLAEIPVHKASAAELQKLNVQLASGDEFERAGVSTGRPTVPLHFAVVDAHGHKVIRITSDAAVNDPFLDLLIEIHGGAGKSVREYTILLDPPGSSPAPMAAHTPARATHAASAPAASAGGQVANGKFGPVERGQTLSVVAQRTLPAGVDVRQMMLALKQANPQAFYRDNINALKAGAVLRIPTKAEAEAVATAAAIAEVQRQNGDWRNGTVSSSPTAVADAGTRSHTSSAPTLQAASKSDHLALVPAKTSAKAAAAAGGSEKGAALKQDLLRSQEQLASLQQQSDSLKSRLKDLNDINSKNERLLALKDSEIAELQQKLAAARKAGGQPTATKPVATAPALAAKLTPVSESTTPTPVPAHAATAAPAHAATAASVAPATSAPATAATVASKPAPAKVEPVKTTPIKHEAAKPAPAPEVEAPWYSQLWAQAAGGAVVVLLLLLALLGRRKKAKPASPLAKTVPSLADRFGDEPAPAMGEGEDAEQNQLLDQLAEHPDDIGLHLELVSLYYDRRDVEHFEAAAEAMHAHVTDPQQSEWQDVVHMGEDLVPGHPLFAATADHAGHESVPGFDIDQYDSGHDDVTAVPAPVPSHAPEPPALPPLPASPATISEYNFNFDLTPATPAPAAAPAHAIDEDATVVRGGTEDWHMAEPAPALEAGHDLEPSQFTDDPSDTKLDLARAYLDMGDPEGARAMLEEVLREGSQTQRDIAKRMIDDLH